MLNILLDRFNGGYLNRSCEDSYAKWDITFLTKAQAWRHSVALLAPFCKGQQLANFHPSGLYSIGFRWVDIAHGFSDEEWKHISEAFAVLQIAELSVFATGPADHVLWRCYQLAGRRCQKLWIHCSAVHPDLQCYGSRAKWHDHNNEYRSKVWTPKELLDDIRLVGLFGSLKVFGLAVDACLWGKWWLDEESDEASDWEYRDALMESCLEFERNWVHQVAAIAASSLTAIVLTHSYDQHGDFIFADSARSTLWRRMDAVHPWGYQSIDCEEGELRTHYPVFYDFHED